MVLFITSHNKLDIEKLMRSQPYTKNWKELKKAGNERGGLPAVRVYQLVVC